MYGVRFVGDDELPEGQDFALCRGEHLFPDSTDDEDMVFFLRESTITEQSLERGWAAFIHMLALSPTPDAIKLRSVS